MQSRRRIGPNPQATRGQTRYERVPLFVSSVMILLTDERWQRFKRFRVHQELGAAFAYYVPRHKECPTSHPSKASQARPLSVPIKKGKRMSDLQLARPSFFSLFWPAVLIPIGLGLTISWICLLGYGLIEVVRLAI